MNQEESQRRIYQRVWVYGSWNGCGNLPRRERRWAVAEAAGECDEPQELLSPG